nr:hypothetical protein OHA15_15805 [Streptomyces anthocyanicus]
MPGRMQHCAMMRIMLCGAADTERVRDAFVQVVEDFGGIPRHFLSGTVNYINSATSSWTENSRESVQDADICVFVIVEEIGRITWETEVSEALMSGKPFLVLCLDKTHQRYLFLHSTFPPPTDLSVIPSEQDRNLVMTLRELYHERQITVAPFTDGSFRDVLRRELSQLFRIAVGHLSERNRRGSAVPLFAQPSRLSMTDLVIARRIALDEFEEKHKRKQALRALAARRALDEEPLYALLNSPEQGIQRLSFELLEQLYTPRPAAPAFLEHLVVIANDSDDVGVPRRMIPIVMAIDLAGAVAALALLDLDDAGCKRRLAACLEAHEDAVAELGLGEPVAELLRACLSGSAPSDWKSRCRAYLDRLGGAPSEGAG